MGRKLTFSLDNRLSLCASFVRTGTRLADVGTDHAYLPVMLAAQGKIRSAVACDVRQGPLENAKASILENDVGHLVRAVLSDGLDNVAPGDAEDIVMAGMGGELIATIIQRTQWLYDSSKRLILQPMTRMETLRLFLAENGFLIEQEKACVSGKKCYSVMCCRYTGSKRSCSPKEQYIGQLDRDPSPEAEQYIRMISSKLQKKAAGLRRSGKSQEAAAFEAVLAEIREAAGINKKNLTEGQEGL